MLLYSLSLLKKKGKHCACLLQHPVHLRIFGLVNQDLFAPQYTLGSSIHRTCPTVIRPLKIHHLTLIRINLTYHCLNLITSWSILFCNWDYPSHYAYFVLSSNLLIIPPKLTFKLLIYRTNRKLPWISWALTSWASFPHWTLPKSL